LRASGHPDDGSANTTERDGMGHLDTGAW
jgi:hypothetical protein